MRIELETLPNHLRTPFPTRCGICHLRFQTGPAIARAITDDGTDWTEVCPKCLEAGPDGIVDQLRRWASWYEAMAEQYAEAAAEGVEDVPTPTELRMMELLA